MGKTNVEPALNICLSVLQQEQLGIQQMIEALKRDIQLAQTVENVVQLLLNTKGRIIVSGMGKSGHIGRKIASTFSSTGQPALFIHPSEASHGDLGMITKDDVIFLLSNSGETQELHDLMHYAVRSHTPMIALSSNAESTINKLSTFSLYIPEVKEACPMGLAPTTSTTVMIALGDALAITLLSFRGFTNKDFYQFHPGGKLGQQLQRVCQIMHTKNLPFVKDETMMDEALIEITKGGFGCVGVLDAADNFIGVITDGDLRRHMDKDFLSKTAQNVMTRNPKTVQEDMLAVEALNYMEEFSITSLFVLNGEKPVGLVHVHDFLRNGIA
jgi:arabinose-5-phosphate isomerase